MITKCAHTRWLTCAREAKEGGAPRGAARWSIRGDQRWMQLNRLGHTGCMRFSCARGWVHVVHGNALLLVLAKGGAQVPLSTAGSHAGDDATQRMSTQMSTQLVDVHTVHTVDEFMSTQRSSTQLTTQRGGVHTVVEVMSTQRLGRVAAGWRLGGCDHRLARRPRSTSRHW